MLSTECTGSGASGSTGQGQLLPVFFPEPLNMSYKVAHAKPLNRWLLVVLGMEVPRQDQAVNQDWLLLVPGLGPVI